MTEDPFENMDAKDGIHIARVGNTTELGLYCQIYVHGEVAAEFKAMDGSPAQCLKAWANPTPVDHGDATRLQLVLEAVARYLTTGGDWVTLRETLTCLSRFTMNATMPYPGYDVLDSYVTTEGVFQHIFVKAGTQDAVVWEEPTQNEAGAWWVGFWNTAIWPPLRSNKMTTQPSGSKQPAEPTREITLPYYGYAIERVLTLRDLLTERLILEYVAPGIVVTGPQFVALVHIVRETLPGRRIPYRVLEDSLRDLAGYRLTAAAAKIAAWRIAGNLQRLRQHFAVPLWCRQVINEWVPAQITACRRQRSPADRLAGATFGFTILAGTPASTTVQHWWSLKQCRHFSQAFGFSRPTSINSRQETRYAYVVPEQLVNLRCYILMEPKRCVDREAKFKDAVWPTVCRKHNRELIKLRIRNDVGYTCPQGYPNAFPCHQCTFGYHQCGAATHAQPWETRHCVGCDQQAYFDPEQPGDLCVDCLIKRSYRASQQQDKSDG